MRIGFALAAAFLCVHAASAAEPVLAGKKKQPRASDVLKAPRHRDIASPITDRFALRVLYFPATISTNLRLDQTNGTFGTELAAENDLGLDDKSQEGRAELVFRLRERNRLRVDYFKLARSGDQVLNRTINFGDQTFNINDRAQTGLEWRALTFTYSRSFWYSERFEIGAGLGFSMLEAKVRGEVLARNIRENHEAVGAFPTFEIDGTWRVSKRWSLSLRGQRFTAHVDEFQGSLADYHGDVQYRWRENFALGLGYTKLRTLVDVGKDGGAGVNDLTGRFDQRVTGPEIFLRASF